MSNKPSILCVDDERNIVESLELALGSHYDVHTASSVAEAQKRIEQERFAVIVTDLNFHGQSEDGLSLINWLNDRGATTPIIILSGDQDTRRVIAAQRRIEDDFVVKPFEVADLVCAIEKARARAAKAVSQSPQRKLHEVLTRDTRIQGALEQIKKVMKSDLDIPVCILGESGSGKEELAKYAASVRGGPFVAINMAAIPESLVESELFGHVRGAFTGAHADKKGVFETARGGVLFLDEIGDCPLPVQVKLLRVLQERVIMPVGYTKDPIKVDVKILCATNQPLEELCKTGRFREELLRRIEGVTIQNPPLRERSSDIAPLVGKFLQEKSPRYRPATITPEALATLESYKWPGNVRELVSVVEQSLLNADFREIGVRHLPPKILGIDSSSATASVAKDTVNFNFEMRMRAEGRRLFNEVLKAANGSREEAQRLTGMSRSTFYKKLGEFGLTSKGSA